MSIVDLEEDINMLSDYDSSVPSEPDEFQESGDAISSEESFDERDDDHDGSESWYDAPLYHGSNQTTGNAVLEVLDIYIKNKQSKKSLDETLKCFHKMLPQPNNLPRSKYLLLKKLQTLVPSNSCIAKKHRICEDCSEYLGLWSKTLKLTNCTNELCNSAYIQGAFFEFDIKLLIKNFCEHRNLGELLLAHKNYSNKVPEGFIHDICSASKYKFWKKEIIMNDFDLCLLWNLDGTPLSESSSSNVWLIQAHPVNIPVSKRRGFQFVCGIFYSRRKKPCMRSFFRPFVETMKVLGKEGIEWYDEKANITRTSIVIAPISTCDAPARAEVQCLSYSNGEFGCFCCEQKGQSATVGSGHNTVFLYPTDKSGNIVEPSQPVEFRSAQKMYLQAQRCLEENLEHVYGVKGPSIAALIPHFDISTGFVTDSLHIFYEGIFKMLLNCFCNTKNKNQDYYLSKHKRQELNRELLNIRPPNSTTRCPRSLEEKNYFKANEFEEMFINYFPILLKDKLHKKYYDHMLLVSYAMKYLTNPVVHQREIDHAEYLLDLFLKGLQTLYGENKMTYNSHVAKHACRYVRMYGQLWNFDTYKFEDFNGFIKSIVQGKNKLDIEIANTMTICNSYNILKYTMNRDSENQDECVECDKRPQNILNDAEKEAIISECFDRNIDFESLILYARIKFKNIEYTSIRYKRQTKRDNSQITWEDSENQMRFGVIQIFYKINDQVYALVRELILNSDQHPISNPQIKFNNMHTEIRNSYCLYNVQLNFVRNKLIRIKNYVCIPGHTGKK